MWDRYGSQSQTNESVLPKEDSTNKPKEALATQIPVVPKPSERRWEGRKAPFLGAVKASGEGGTFAVTLIGYPAAAHSLEYAKD